MARKLEVAIVGDASSYQRALAKASGSSGTFGSKVTRMGKIAAAGLAVVGAAGVAAGVKMIGLASDAAEVDSKFRVIFGRQMPRLTKNIDKFAEATGASRFEMRKQVADLGALLQPIVKNRKAAGDMSVDFVKLANDLASFNNVPTADALEAIRSGLVGETEPMRRFGVLLNENAVKNEAYRLGLAKTGDELTETQKVQARASLIMQQTALAQGDATRTADSFANQIKRLKNTVKDTATEVGQKLLPHVQNLIEFINTKAIPAIEGFFDELGRAEGFKAKIKVVWTGISNVVSDLFDSIQKQLFGSREALRLPTGQILEWKETQGLVDKLRMALESADWAKIGATIGQNITSKVRITADFLGRAFDTLNRFVDSHLDQFAEIGAKMLLAIVGKLTDPAFWKENWKLVLGVAVAVFPLGRVFTLGGKVARMLLAPIAKLLPEGFRTIGFRATQALLGVLGRLPGAIQRLVLAGVSAAIRVLQGLLSFLRGVFRNVLDRIPGWLKAAFRVSFAVGLLNTVKDIYDWLRKLVGKVWKIVIDVELPKGPGGGLLDKLQHGTSSWKGGPAIVGERGPELVNLPRGAQVIPNHRLRGGAGGGGGFPGGAVMILTTREVATWLQGLDRDYKRANGGRPILGT